MSGTSAARGESVLLTDFYQLTMLNAYDEQRMEQEAVFEFFVRRLPDTRNFLIAAGLQSVLGYLETLRFTAADIDWLRSTGRFREAFLQRLGRLRFTGSVDALPEGTVYFGGEPVLRVVAPLPQAQLIESRIVNLLHYQTLVASKAARCRLAAGDRQLIDFGMRRAHGGEAAVLAARASYIAGFDATSNVEAAREYAIPFAGTMAHSFIQAHDREIDAFRNFARSSPRNVVLLIDTYDIDRAARRVTDLDMELRSEGISVAGVRIDSGDLFSEVPRVRQILDAGGCPDIRILVSGGLDEFAIAALRRAGAPVDTYCVGTQLTVSEDVPALDCAYKLQEYGGKPCRKRSPHKQAWPGSRQVFRSYDADGCIRQDVVGCAREALGGRRLMQRVMSEGRRLEAAPTLAGLRSYCTSELATLPPELRCMEKGPPSPVVISEGLRALAAAVDHREH